MIALRGAIGVSGDDRAEVLKSTAELLFKLVEENKLQREEIVSVIFTATSDLCSVYPAVAARESLGWDDIPLLCMQEMAVEGSLPFCIRVLLHVERENGSQAKHVYLGSAAALRPDIAE